jgi:hypothetical protein
MAKFISYRIALFAYWMNILLLGMERRIIIAQGLYALGALLCLVNTYCSLGFILLVQMNYVLAPRLGFLER